MSSFQEAIKSPVGRKKKKSTTTSSENGFVSSIPPIRTSKLKVDNAGNAAAGSIVGKKKTTHPIPIKKELGIVSIGSPIVGNPIVVHEMVPPLEEDEHGAVVDNNIVSVSAPSTMSPNHSLSVGNRIGLLISSRWRDCLDPSENMPALLVFLILSVAWTALLWVAFADLK